MPSYDLDRSGWTITADSTYSSYTPDLMIDGNLATYWESMPTGYPISIIIDLGSAQEFDVLRVTPYPGYQDYLPSSVEVYYSTNGIDWGVPVATKTWALLGGSEYIVLPRLSRRYLKLTGLAGATTVMLVTEINLTYEQGLSRFGWTATADLIEGPSTLPNFALDGDPTSRWSSGNMAYPHWIAVDMQVPREFDYVRFKTGDAFVANPEYVELYVSSDGINWGSAIATAVWPSDFREQFIYITDTTGVRVRTTARHLKLVGVIRTVGLLLNYMWCSEIHAGVLATGDDYKVYWKAHPQTYLQIPEASTGEIDYLELQLDITSPGDLQLAHSVGQERVWSTSSLAFYPEMVSSLYDLPVTWPLTPGLETMSAVVEGQYHQASTTNPPGVSMILSYSDTTIQAYFDFRFAWYGPGGNSTIPLSNTLWDKDVVMPSGIVPADIPVTPDLLHPDLFMHEYVWGALIHHSPDHLVDVNRLAVADQYLLLVWPAVNTNPITNLEIHVVDVVHVTEDVKFHWTNTPPVPPTPPTPPGPGGGGVTTCVGSFVEPCLLEVTKHPSDILDLPIDWSDWLGTDRIGSVSSTLVSGDIAIVSVGYTDTVTTPRISGGTVNTDGKFKIVTTTQNGLVEGRTVRVKVESC